MSDDKIIKTEIIVKDENNPVSDNEAVVPTPKKPKKPVKKLNKQKSENSKQNTSGSTAKSNSNKKTEKVSGSTENRAADIRNNKQLAELEAKLSEVLSILDVIKTQDLDQKISVLSSEIGEIKKQETENQSLLYGIEKTISSNDSALANANRTIADLSSSNKELTLRLGDAETELASFRRELANKKSELAEMQNKLAAAENENNELVKRFESAVNTNNSFGDDVKAALIQKLTDALSMSYDDFNEYKNAEYSEDNYDTLKVILKSVFRTLSANGIKF